MRGPNYTRGWTTEEKTCTSKMRHSTRRKALRAADRQWQENRVVVTVYRCPFCDGWHLTTQLKSKTSIPRKG